MSKGSYKIPFSMDYNYLDLEIALQNSNGVGLKPVPLKQILFVIGGLILGLFLVTNTPLRNGNILQIIVFVVLWLVFVFMLAQVDRSKTMTVFKIPTLLNYIPKRNRIAITRASSNPIPFFSIANILSLNKDGVIQYSDGTFGKMYMVVGSASILLFEADRDAILDRVGSFWRNFNINCEAIFITNKEPQKVHNQITHLKKQYDNLTVDDADLVALINMQYDTLANKIGKNYKSIHQYLILKCDSLEDLTANEIALCNEVESSSKMIKRCVPLYEENIAAVLKPIYS